MKHWVVPSVYTVVSILVASVLPRLENAFLPHFVHAMSPAAAMAFLSSTASGILAFTGIVFSIAFVMVQFNALAYSPRLVLWFAGRPELYHALGIFIATFTYSVATLMWTDRGGSGTVPFLSVMVVVALLCASMLIFSLLVKSLSRLQITEVLRFVGDEGRAVIAAHETFQPLRDDPALPAPSRPRVAAVRRILHAGPPLVVCAIDFPMLLRVASVPGVTASIRVAVGDTVQDGMPLLDLDRETGLRDEDVRAAFRLGPERTFEQDPKYALRLLVDIAIKALSPAINDPTTAVQAIDQIEDLVCRLGRMSLGSTWLTDPDGRPCLFVPLPTWNDYVSLAFDEIRQFGASSVQVMRKLQATLDHLDEVCGEGPNRDVVRRYARHLDSAIRHLVLDDDDRTAALQPDPQGLGFARDEPEARAGA